MAKFAGALAQLNVGKGDRVVIYMPMVPQVDINSALNNGAPCSINFSKLESKV